MVNNLYRMYIEEKKYDTLFLPLFVKGNQRYGSTNCTVI